LPFDLAVPPSRRHGSVGFPISSTALIAGDPRNGANFYRGTPFALMPLDISGDFLNRGVSDERNQ
jgi:hypothetical protein